MTSHVPVLLVDPAKVRSARLARGYPERVLSGILGVSNRVIDRLEEGCDQSQLDVRFVSDLAAALGRDVAELLPDRLAEQAGAESDRVDDCDAANIGALLATDGGQVHIDIAAQALGWTRNRALVALHRLEERLRATGQRLAWLDELSVGLAAAPVDESVVTDVARRDVVTFGLTSGEARMLNQLVVTGEPARIGDWDAKERQHLVRAGLLELDLTSPTSSKLPMRLSDDARFALVLDDGDQETSGPVTTR